MAETIPQCLARAAVSRAAAEAERLEQVRNKHIASAEVWEELARLRTSQAAVSTPSLEP